MVGLSVGGVLVGLVPPLALGVLVNALVERNDKHEAALLAGLIAIAILVEATAYVLSDGMYARNAGKLHRDPAAADVRRCRAAAVGDDEDSSGIPSRFISDVVTLDQITVSILDTGSMLLVEFVSAAVAIGLLEPVDAGGDLPDARRDLDRHQENAGTRRNGRATPPGRARTA